MFHEKGKVRRGDFSNSYFSGRRTRAQRRTQNNSTVVRSPLKCLDHRRKELFRHIAQNKSSDERPLVRKRTRLAM
jgi:hypothetical protein